MKKKEVEKTETEKKNILSSIFGFWKPDSNQLVFIVAGIVIFGGFLISRYAGVEKLNTNVQIEDNAPIENFKKSRTQLNSDSIRLGETDPTLKLAERTREASALAIGLGWYVLNERVTDSPKITPDVSDLMQDFARSPLLPPGCRVLNTTVKTDYGLVQTARGLYFIRYRARPVMIEILASGRDSSLDGAVFSLRLPDRQAAEYLVNQPNSADVKIAGAWASIYVAPENQNAYIPPAFAPGSAYINTGWKPDVLRVGDFSPEKINGLQKFLEVGR